MKVSSREIASLLVVDVSGELDLYNSADLKSVLQALIAEGKFEILLNLKDVPYIDSTGIAVLLDTLRQLKQRNGDLKIVTPSEGVYKIFQMTHLTKFFQIFDSETAAAGPTAR